MQEAQSEAKSLFGKGTAVTDVSWESVTFDHFFVVGFVCVYILFVLVHNYEVVLSLTHSIMVIEKAFLMLVVCEMIYIQKEKPWPYLWVTADSCQGFVFLSPSVNTCTCLCNHI